VAAVSPLPLAPEALDGLQAAQAALEQQVAKLRACGDPAAETITAIAATLKAMGRLTVDAALKTEANAKASGAMIEEIRKPLVDEAGRAVRSSLHSLRPEFERRWLWRRWAELLVAGTVGAAVMGGIGYATWQASAAVAQRDATTEAAKWSAWCNTPGHRVLIAGKAVCQVPLEPEVSR
jgi:hypothetical protein